MVVSNVFLLKKLMANTRVLFSDLFRVLKQVLIEWYGDQMEHCMLEALVIPVTGNKQTNYGTDCND